MSDKGSIHTTTVLPQAPEKVWRALTDPMILAEWLMPNDFVPRLGHDFTFRTEAAPNAAFDGIVRCQVVAIEPPRFLRISWVAPPDLDTTVTWRLLPEGAGTRLTLDHEGFDETNAEQQATRRILGGGWQGHMRRRLESVLNSMPTAPRACREDE